MEKSQLAPQSSLRFSVFVTLHRVHLPEGAARRRGVIQRTTILRIFVSAIWRRQRAARKFTRWRWSATVCGPRRAGSAHARDLGSFRPACSVGRRRGRAAATCSRPALVPARTPPHAVPELSHQPCTVPACRRRRPLPSAESLSQHHAVARPYARGHAVQPAPGCGHSG